MLVVAVSGGFDPIHKGHVRYIKKAMELGRVIVILTRDDQLATKKGKAFMEYDERQEILEAIIGDRGEVVPNIDSTIASIDSIRKYKPDIFAKGGDTWDAENLPEADVCKELGIKVVFGVGGVNKVQSSSQLIRLIKEGKTNNIVVLLPTLDEETAIGKTIKDIQECTPSSRIWVVDSSKDGTPKIAVDAGAHVIPVPKKGKGWAIRDAIWLLRLTSRIAPVDYVIMMDGDYTYSANHIPEIIGLLNDGVDVVAGYRHARERGAMTAINVIGNWGLSLIASICYRRHIRDVCTGMWGFTADALKGMYLESDRFTLEADLFSNVVSSGCKLTQIPIGYRARQDGSSSKLKILDGFRIALFIIKHRTWMRGNKARKE